MRYLRYLALLSIFLLPATLSHAAQVAVGVGVGVAPAPYVAYGPPACSYGYYPYAPYTCAPYGYYGPSWFTGGVFIGAGPWFRAGYGYRGYYPYRGGYYGRPVYGPGYRPAVPYRGGVAVARGGFSGGFHGNVSGGFHGGGGRR
jgi:hypothetical protein